MRGPALTATECGCMRELHRAQPDKWTVAVLKMTFELSTAESVRHHIEGECDHSTGVAPLLAATRSTDGKTQTQQRILDD
jgi:hypothetical protein